MMKEFYDSNYTVKISGPKLWINLIKQFREDVLPAEELQIKQFITIDILINRSMKERKRHITETEKLQKAVDKEYAKTDAERDIPKLANVDWQNILVKK